MDPFMMPWQAQAPASKTGTTENLQTTAAIIDQSLPQYSLAAMLTRFRSWPSMGVYRVFMLLTFRNIATQHTLRENRTPHNVEPASDCDALSASLALF
jgi:hypothetical protein